MLQYFFAVRPSSRRNLPPIPTCTALGERGARCSGSRFAIGIEKDGRPDAVLQLADARLGSDELLHRV